MKKWITGATFAVALIGFASQAGATVLTPGNTVAASAFLSTDFVSLLATTGPQAVDSGTFSATAQAWVYTDNSICAGCLDFVYQVTRTGPSALTVVGPAFRDQAIESINMGSFGAFTTNVGYVAGSGLIPDSVNRSVSGAVVSFNYPTTNITGTQSSDLLVIKTNANFYTAGTMTVTDSLSVNAAAFQPTLVPEPMTFSLLGAGLLGLGLLRKRISRS